MSEKASEMKLNPNTSLESGFAVKLTSDRSFGIFKRFLNQEKYLLGHCGSMPKFRKIQKKNVLLFHAFRLKFMFNAICQSTEHRTEN